MTASPVIVGSMGSTTQRIANASARVISSRVLAARRSTLPSARPRIHIGVHSLNQANVDQNQIELDVHTNAGFVNLESNVLFHSGE